MRRLGFLLFFVSGLAVAQPRTSRCWAACERNVFDPRVRASACGACLTRPDDTAAWLGRAPTPLARLLEDPDWEVRWAGLRLEATRAKTTPARQLSAWASRSTGAELQRACVTAVHAAGVERRTLASLLDQERAALEGCVARAAAVRHEVATGLYDPQGAVRREALLHLGHAFDRRPARVVLDVVPSRPAAFDALVLETLADVTLETDATAPAELLAAATPADVLTMNRLLAVFSAQRDEARAGLRAVELVPRKEAMARLASLAPLSEPELLDAVSDPDPGLRLAAGRGLARGEHSSLAAVAARRLSGERPATLAQQRGLLRLVGDTQDPACAATALETWRDPTRDFTLRALALPVAASCRWEAAREDVEQVLTRGAPEAQAAAVAALAFAPPSPQVFERLTWASGALRPDVRDAALRSMATRRWRGGLPRVTAGLSDPDPTVRITAVRALVTLDAPNVEGRLAQQLEADRDPAVRRVAAELLGTLGGPRAITALQGAARKDPDVDVKFVATQSLRTLGVGSLTP